VRKSVRAIGRCAIKIDTTADQCVQQLVELIQTKVDYVVQEAVIVIKVTFFYKDLIYINSLHRISFEDTQTDTKKS
jgi:vesicle coat complex subunit